MKLIILVGVLCLFLFGCNNGEARPFQNYSIAKAYIGYAPRKRQLDSIEASIWASVRAYNMPITHEYRVEQKLDTIIQLLKKLK